MCSTSVVRDRSSDGGNDAGRNVVLHAQDNQRDGDEVASMTAYDVHEQDNDLHEAGTLNVDDAATIRDRSEADMDCVWSLEDVDGDPEMIDPTRFELTQSVMSSLDRQNIVSDDIYHFYNSLTHQSEAVIKNPVEVPQCAQDMPNSIRCFLQHCRDENLNINGVVPSTTASVQSIQVIRAGISGGIPVISVIHTKYNSCARSTARFTGAEDLYRALECSCNRLK